MNMSEADKRTNKFLANYMGGSFVESRETITYDGSKEFPAYTRSIDSCLHIMEKMMPKSSDARRGWLFKNIFMNEDPSNFLARTLKNELTYNAHDYTK